MKKTIIALIVLAGVGIATYYLVFNKGTSDVLPTIEEVKQVDVVQPDTSNTAVPTIEDVKPTDITKPDSAPTITNIEISIKDLRYLSQNVTVKPGTTVIWTNNDTAPHTVTSDSGNTLNSGTLSTGKSFSYTFTTEGTFAYHCTIHPNMNGTVVVKN